MDVKTFLAKGWIPRELPPVFSGESFSNFIEFKHSLLPAVKKTSRGIRFTTPRAGLVRRTVFLTNPMHQTKLFSELVTHWNDLFSKFKESSLSFSVPMENGPRAINLPSFKDYQVQGFKRSFHHKYLVKTDISKYFPSLYTHSIPWALHTKSAAKNNRGSSLLGNRIDQLIRDTQDGQTIGIPIGPDSSQLIAEIIGTEIDKYLQQRIPNIVGGRYVDDMYYYFDDYTQCELFIKELQFIAKEYELQINPDKTKIFQLPIGIEDKWIIELRRFKFEKSKVEQSNDIISYFSLAYNYAKEFPDAYVLSYAINKIHSAMIYPSNYDLLESMLLKTIVNSPAVLPDVLKILLVYRKLVHKDKIKKAIQTVILYAVPRAYDFEVLWALWYCHTFSIKIDDEVAVCLNQLIDPLSVLMTISLLKVGLINDSVLDLVKIIGFVNEDSLWDEKWILVYELIKKNWGVIPTNIIIGSKKNRYFEILNNNDVTFFDLNNQVDFKPKYGKKKNRFWEYFSKPELEFGGYQ